ncbi:MAG: hypothetical protein ACFFDX_13685 [Candidatus Odinarchaeota archaeon]
MISNSKIREEKKEKTSRNLIIKKILFLLLVGINIGFFVYFLFISHQNLVLTLVESIISLFLFTGVIYIFFRDNPYYFYIFIGIFICSIIVSFPIPIMLIIVIPEFIYLYYISQRSFSAARVLAKMRWERKALAYGLRMTHTWDPKNISKHLQQVEENKKLLYEKYSMRKIVIFTVICTIGFLITSIQAVVLYFY